ncbi:hypothetical protein B296_00004567 [Ensete ventricosum]|uniref:Uncharacterized protein n=1 Tax=Ensete ventricosum TaxID=4639 RepID=A0A427AZZ0_ENSVE|nr:hypothetical protein B296_00004567 [Ensete ventricosum]
MEVGRLVKDETVLSRIGCITTGKSCAKLTEVRGITNSRIQYSCKGLYADDGVSMTIPRRLKLGVMEHWNFLLRHGKDTSVGGESYVVDRNVEEYLKTTTPQISADRASDEKSSHDMIGATGELDCSSAYIRLREPNKPKDKAKEKKRENLEIWCCSPSTIAIVACGEKKPRRTSYLLENPSSSGLSPRVPAPDVNDTVVIISAPTESCSLLLDQVQKHVQIRMEAYQRYIDSLIAMAYKIASDQIAASSFDMTDHQLMHIATLSCSVLHQPPSVNAINSQSGGRKASLSAVEGQVSYQKRHLN